MKLNLHSNPKTKSKSHSNVPVPFNRYSSDRVSAGNSTRRSFCRGVGALSVTVSLGSVAGCIGPWNDSAHYWSDPGQTTEADADYETVRANAEAAGYTVEAPYYVNSKTPGGIHPTGIAELDTRFGPDYRIFGFSFYHTPDVSLNISLTGGLTVGLHDERILMEDFLIDAVPPENWIVDRLRRSFDISESDARVFAADLREQVVAGIEIPQIDLTATVTFPSVYDYIRDNRDAVSGSQTSGGGWYNEISYRNESRFADVAFVVQSLEVIHHDGNREYRLKLDRLGGYTLEITLPAGDEIPEAEYRETYRQLFADVGLDPDHVSERTFEYTGSIW